MYSLFFFYHAKIYIYIYIYYSKSSPTSLVYAYYHQFGRCLFKHTFTNANNNEKKKPSLKWHEGKIIFSLFMFKYFLIKIIL